MDDLETTLESARERLQGVPWVRLGLGRRASGLKRMLGRKPVIEPVGFAHHLGVLLLGQAQLWATGDIIRAAREERRGFTAESQRVRAYMSDMAARGGFLESEVCHIDWEEIPVPAVAAGESAGPLVWRDGRLTVRWSPAGFLVPLDQYLDERVDLALAQRAAD